MVQIDILEKKILESFLKHTFEHPVLMGRSYSM